jgi:hypothetical protein
MIQPGRVAFGAMEEVLFGTPAAEAIPDLARRYDARRVLLMVSATLDRETDEIEKVRSALGERCHRGGQSSARGPRRSHLHHRRRLDHRRREGGAAVPRQ